MKDRNSIHMVHLLEPGDRFYVKGDKAKTIYEVREHLNKGGQTLAVKQPATIAQEANLSHLYVKTLRGYIEVIYLRTNPESRYI